MASSPDVPLPAQPRTFRPRWGEVVFVCGKCLKRHDDGKALRRALKSQMKAAGKTSPKGRKPRLVKTACLGLCPKRAVVVASGEAMAKGEVMLVRDVDEISAAIES